METVLVVGSTGNIGVSAVLAVLRSKRNVLAVVRSQSSADKLFQHVGTKEGITVVEADVTSEGGIKGVVDQVKAGKLPAFQHVYSCAGGAYAEIPLLDLKLEEMKAGMHINFETNLFAYQATVPYLLEQNNPGASWTLCTGSQGDLGMRAQPALTQGALFSMANIACRDNADTNIRFNEVYLDFRVEVDAMAEKSGAMKASEFSKNYAALLSRPDIKGCRVSVYGHQDLQQLRYEPKHR